jgi:molybdopterin converting factor small subunit
MIHVQVKMLGTLREASGKGEVEFTFPSRVDVAQVVRSLIDECGGGLGTQLLDPVLQSPQPNALILLDGVEINNLDGLRTPVGDGAALILLPVTHGG